MVEEDCKRRTNILGVGISPINIATAVSTIERWILAGERHYVCVTGVHGVMESQHDEELRRIHNASGLTTPDGMPLVWLGRILGYPGIERVYGPDLMLAFSEVAALGGYRNFYFGGAQGIPEELARKLKARFPGLVVAGTLSPPFRSLSANEDEHIVRIINQSGADVVWVGLSTPKQEKWMASHREKLAAPVLIGVGAAFDFHSGRKPQAPPWVRSTGLEWLFRLMQEPRRLWRRYLVNNPLFVWHISLQLLRLKSYSLELAGTSKDI